MDFEKSAKRRTIIKKLNSDLERLRTKYPDCVLDGIVDFNYFERAYIKMLWILKEVNDEDGGRWDLREFLSSSERLTSYNRWKNTYASVIEVSFGILNGYPDYEQVHSNIEAKIPILKKVAIININKLPGNSRNYYRNLQKAFEQFKDIILNQIESINPDVIIGGGTLWLLYDVLNIKDSEINKCDKHVYSFVKNDQLWLAAYHPGQSIITHEKYYTEIIKKVKDWKAQWNISYSRHP